MNEENPPTRTALSSPPANVTIEHQLLMHMKDSLQEIQLRMQGLEQSVGVVKDRLDGADTRLGKIETKLDELVLWKAKLSGAWLAMTVVAAVLVVAGGGIGWLITTLLKVTPR